MTVREGCDVAYALLVERIERQVSTDRMVAAVFIAAGAKDVKLPDVGDARRALDAALLAPAPSQERRALLEALGVTDAH